jgi:DNA-binding NtrC family response regulator
LNILPITIPPLRERGGKDIQLLANHFIEKYLPGYCLPPDAAMALAAYNWPGNVRELENTIQLALHLCDGDMIKPEHLSLMHQSEKTSPCPAGMLQAVEQEMIVSILTKTKFNMARSAKDLGISRATLYRKIKTYRISKKSVGNH